MIESEQIVQMACDHGGYEMKEFIKMNLIKEGFIVEDFGTNSPESVDYPDFIHPISKAIDAGKYKLGIIICGSGNGAQMTANKYQGVRAALCWNEEITRLARLHNDANIIALPGRFIDFDLALKMVKLFLTTDFEGGRHSRRVEKMAKKNW